VLEADLYRSEAKLAALTRQQDAEEDHISPPSHILARHVNYVRGPDGEVLPEDPEEIPRSKEEGLDRWRREMTMRFLGGDDEDFAYKEVDESDIWDIIESQEEEERWFDDEEPDWVDHAKDKAGETGVQDF
jgi:hypothetical protein